MQRKKNILNKKQKIMGLLALVLNLTLIFNAHLMNTNIDFKSNEDFNQIQTLRPSSTSDYGYYKEITILSSKVSGTGSHINFPVLISLIDSDLHDQCQADGDDIAFYDGTTLLDHEIEEFNRDYSGTEAKLVAWVRIPTLSTSSNTIIRMYYGNSNISSIQNPEGVWNSDYKGVWHLSQDPTFVTIDSTANGNDCQEDGGMGSQDRVAGKIGQCLNFDGSTHLYKSYSGTSLDFTDEFTMESWINLPNANQNQKIFGKCDLSPDWTGFLMGVNSDGTIYSQIWDVTNTNHASSGSGTIVSNEWTHLAVTWKTNGRMIGYLDGSVVFDISASPNAMSSDNEEVFRIGAAPWDPNYYRTTGTIDEVRVSSSTRSAGWIATEYNNQNDPDDFYSISELFIVAPGESQPDDNGIIILGIITVLIAIFTLTFGGYLKNKQKKASKAGLFKQKKNNETFGKNKYRQAQFNENIIKVSFEVICPKCHAKSKVIIPKDTIDKAGSVTTVSIAKNSVCPHHFQAFVDKNLAVRGYQKVDVTIDFESEGIATNISTIKK